MTTLDELREASAVIRRMDENRKNQQAFRDDLIRRAVNEGIGWAEIQRATGMLDRSLALALKRTDPGVDGK